MVSMKGLLKMAIKSWYRMQSATRRSTLSRDDRIFSLSSHASPIVNMPMDDDVHSLKYDHFGCFYRSSADSTPLQKMKRNRKKKSMYGEDEYE